MTWNIILYADDTMIFVPGFRDHVMIQTEENASCTLSSKLVINKS